MHVPQNVQVVDQLQTGVDDPPSTLSVMEGYIRKYVSLSTIVYNSKKSLTSLNNETTLT